MGDSPLELYTTGGQEGPYSDIYALSATIYKAVTGITPPPATDRITDDKLVPPIKAGAKGMSPSQEKALLKGMAVRAQDRYQRVEDLYAGLCGKAAKSGGGGKGSARKRGKSSKPLAIAVAAAAAVLAVALGLFFLLRGKPDKKALPEEMFREVPDIYEVYRNGGGEYPFGVRAYVTPDEVFLTGGDEDWRQTEDPDLRSSMSGDALSQALDGLYDSGLPIDIIVFRNLSFETLKPLDRPWPNPVELIFDACTLPDDLSAIGGMGDTLTSLHIDGGASLGDLSWMRSLTSLKWLALGGEGIDVDSIVQMTSLTGVSLGEAHIADLTPFAAMKNLTSLHVPGSDVSDLTPLAGMAGLEELGLSSNNISDLVRDDREGLLWVSKTVQSHFSS